MDNNVEKQLDLLIDGLIDDIISTPDDEILQEVKEYLESKYGEINIQNKDGKINGLFWNGIIKDMEKYAEIKIKEISNNNKSRDKIQQIILKIGIDILTRNYSYLIESNFSIKDLRNKIFDIANEIAFDSAKELG